jgi:hypothetical protein
VTKSLDSAMRRLEGTLSEQLPELLLREPCIFHDPSHNVSIYRIAARNGENPDPISHYNMLPLPRDAKPCLLQCPNRSTMIDSLDSSQD